MYLPSFCSLIDRRGLKGQRAQLLPKLVNSRARRYSRDSLVQVDDFSSFNSSQQIIFISTLIILFLDRA
jgi:hypothetical protein